MVDVPCGVPVTWGVGTICGAAAEPPPHAATPKKQISASVASGVADSRGVCALKRRARKNKNSSSSIAQDASVEIARRVTKGGTCGAAGRVTTIVLAVVATLTT